MPELVGDLAASWLREQYQRAEQQRQQAADAEVAAFRRWQAAVDTFHAADDATDDAWAALTEARTT